MTPSVPIQWSILLGPEQNWPNKGPVFSQIGNNLLSENFFNINLKNDEY